MEDDPLGAFKALMIWAPIGCVIDALMIGAIIFAVIFLAG